MSRCVKDNADLLRALARMSPKRRKSFLKVADKDLVQSICECGLNTLNGVVPLNCAQKRLLSRHKHTLRRLTNRKGNWKAKKRYLVQSGGALLPALLAPIIASVLSSLV